jgi:hypothetical protein
MPSSFQTLSAVRVFSPVMSPDRTSGAPFAAGGHTGGIPPVPPPPVVAPPALSPPVSPPPVSPPVLPPPVVVVLVVVAPVPPVLPPGSSQAGSAKVPVIKPRAASDESVLRMEGLLMGRGHH